MTRSEQRRGSADPSRGDAAPFGSPTNTRGSDQAATGLAEKEAISAPLGEGIDPANLVAERARVLIAKGDEAERARVVSHLLAFAPWEELWATVDRAEVARLFPHHDLPLSLRARWATYLGLDA
ncbi:MAG: hypothetical protein AAGN46_18765, partial [Acidobacteriota bacterium]